MCEKNKCLALWISDKAFYMDSLISPVVDRNVPSGIIRSVKNRKSYR